MSHEDLDNDRLSEQLSETIQAAEELDDAERRKMLMRVARIGAAAVPAAAVLLNSKQARAQTTSKCEGFGCD